MMTSKPTKPRPALFRALGNEQLPRVIEVDGDRFELLDTLKHDSWAATGLYGNSKKKIVCKFNRQHRVLIMPMRWLGRVLARREAFFLGALSDLDGIPRRCGSIAVDGAVCATAVAHDFIEGHPLRYGDRVADDFFPTLGSLLAGIHRRDIAYADLHKIENIIVGLDGRPYLIDFQICFAPPRNRPLAALTGSRLLLDLLQQADRYHVMKHFVRFRPDLVPPDQQDITTFMPAFIKWHRVWIGDPFRRLRRAILVRLSIRSGIGEAGSEVFPEDAVRRDQARAALHEPDRDRRS